MNLRQLSVILSVLVLCLAIVWPAQAATVIKVEQGNPGAVADDLPDQTITRSVPVLTGDIPLGALVSDVNLLVSFHKVDDLDCSGPSTGSSFSDEIDLTLISPQGTEVDLVVSKLLGNPTYSDFGPAPLVEITFDDEATGQVGVDDNGLPTSGSWKPHQPLSAFDGESPVGTWDLVITNVYGGNALCYYYFQLTIETTGAQPGVTIDPLSLTVNEAGGSAQFTVVLNTQPSATVLISFSTSDATEGDMSPAAVSFGPSNWDVPKNVTVTGKDDLEADGDVIFFIRSNIVSSTDPDYNGLNPPDVLVTNIDNEPSDTLKAIVGCQHPNMIFNVFSGQPPFEVTASSNSLNVPVTYNTYGIYQIDGPDKWDNLTVTEIGGDQEALNLGTVKCRPLETPTPLTPAHRARITDTTPTFTWSSIPEANRYIVFLFDNKVPADRNVDIRQRSSGNATQLTLGQTLNVGRYFWRVRGRVNRVWGFWSIRFTLFVDPPAVLDQSSPPVVAIVPRDAPPITSDTSVPQDGAIPTQMPAPGEIIDTTGLMEIDADDAHVIRDGTWNSRPSATATNGSSLHSTAVGDSLTLHVTGDRVGLRVVMNPTMSTMVIEIDDVMMRAVRTSEADGLRTIMINGLSDSAHTVRVFGQDGPIALDSFLVVGLAPYIPGSDGAERPSDRGQSPNPTDTPPNAPLPTIPPPGDGAPTSDPNSPVIEPPNQRTQDGVNEPGTE